MPAFKYSKTFDKWYKLKKLGFRADHDRKVKK